MVSIYLSSIAEYKMINDMKTNKEEKIDARVLNRECNAILSKVVRETSLRQ